MLKKFAAMLYNTFTFKSITINQVMKKNYNFETIDQNFVVFVSLRIAYVLGALEIRVFQASFEIMKISPSLSHVATNCRPNFAVFSSPSSRKNKLYHMWYLSFKRRLLNSVSWVVEFQSWMHKLFSSK